MTAEEEARLETLPQFKILYITFIHSTDILSTNCVPGAVPGTYLYKISFGKKRIQSLFWREMESIKFLV